MRVGFAIPNDQGVEDPNELLAANTASTREQIVEVNMPTWPCARFPRAPIALLAFHDSLG